MLKKMVLTGIVASLLVGCSATGTESENISSEEAENSQTSEGGSSSNQASSSESEVAGVDEAKYYIDPDSSQVVPVDDSVDGNVVLATVDDVPRKLPETPTSSVEEAQTMADRGITGIYFVNGMYLMEEDAEEGREALKQIADMGHVIGNHTLTHYSLDQVPDEETLRREIVGNQDIIEEVIGYRPTFFRAPHGIETPESKAILEEEDMVSMTWSYGFDWDEQYSDPQALANVMVETELLQPGANLLMHDLTWTNEAMPQILDGIAEKGYGFVDPNEIANREEMVELGLEP